MMRSMPTPSSSPTGPAPSSTGRKPSWTAAARILAGRDPVIARLLAETGPPRLSRPAESHLGTLVRAIVYQQLAGRAAAAIHGRLIAALGGEVEPEGLLALSDEQMRAVGLSGAKVASLRDLAAKVLDGTVVLSPRGLARESDDEIVARLSAVRGIGTWTAEMFLLFQLRRLDVWPVGDLGVRRGYGLAWQIPEPTARELRPLGDPFRPYRSVAAWYCWRAAERYAGAADSALTRLREVAAAASRYQETARSLFTGVQALARWQDRAVTKGGIRCRLKPRPGRDGYSSRSPPGPE
jgi:DNA-3-methyladenine glycosylase II